MKHNILPVAFSSIALTAIFIILFVVGYTVLHQIINFLITYPGTGLHQYK